MKKLLVTTFLFITLSAISLAQWVSIGGPSGGGSTRALFIDKTTTPHTIYADVNADGVTEKGAFRSTDGGATWNRAVMDSTKTIAIDCFGVGPTGTVYALGGYLYKSTNSGVSWSKQSALSVGGNSLAIESATTMYAGSFGSIYKSTNGGVNWSALSFNYLGSNTVISVAANTLYAANNGYGVYKSTDGGATWLPAKNGITDSTITSLVMESSTTLYAGAGKGIFKSTDGGANWSAVNNGIPANPAITSLALESAGVVYAGTFGGGVYKTTDGGANWSLTGLSSGRVNYVASDIAGTMYAGLNDYSDGIYKTTDGGTTWQAQSANKYIVTNMAWSEKNSTLYVISRGIGVFKTSDNGATWAELSKTFSNKYINAIAIESPGTLYVGGTDGNIYKTTDDGSTWNDVSVTSMSTEVNTLLILQPGTVLAGMTYGGISKTTDGGTSWSRLLNSTASVNDLLMESQGVLYSRTSVINKSVDGGATWAGRSLVSIGIELGGPIRVALESPGVMYATMKTSSVKGIYKSTDSANTWTAVNSGLSDWDITSYAIPMPGTVFASSSSKGVFKTTNGGTNWSDVSTGIGDKQVKVLAMSSTSIYAGTPNGVFRTTRPTAVKEDVQHIMPEKFELSQNYPNPFNPSTVIEFRVPNNGLVTLKVYDILGREVATLVNESKSSGAYKTAFNAEKLSGGIYFYRLQSGNFEVTKKMILIK